MKLTINFPEAGLGLKLNCNSEAAFDQEQVNRLWTCLLLLLEDPAHYAGESEFIKLWLAADVLPEAQRKDLPTQPPGLASHMAEREFLTGLRQLRSGLATASARATVYKHLIAAALVSEKRLDRLMTLISAARELLELETTTATLISDLIAAEVPEFPHHPAELSRAERETILAMAILVLNADEQKHILELTALRTVMLALHITATNNAQMATLAQKGVAGLIGYLSVSVLPTALLHILRIVIADRAIHEREKQTIRAIAKKMDAKQVQIIRKLVSLECGTSFDF
jgi:hypothetical protein